MNRHYCKILMNTILELIPSDLWLIIDNYLFNPKILRDSIDYLVTLRTLGYVSEDVRDIVKKIRNNRKDQLTNQCNEMHVKILYNRLIVDIKCVYCNMQYQNNLSIIFYNCKGYYVCGKCLFIYNYVGVKMPECYICNYKYDIDCGVCIGCNKPEFFITLNKLKHWNNNNFIIYSICNDCIVMSETHQCLNSTR